MCISTVTPTDILALNDTRLPVVNPGLQLTVLTSLGHYADSFNQLPMLISGKFLSIIMVSTGHKIHNITRNIFIIHIQNQYLEDCDRNGENLWLQNILSEQITFWRQIRKCLVQFLQSPTCMFYWLRNREQGIGFTKSCRIPFSYQANLSVNHINQSFITT